MIQCDSFMLSLCLISFHAYLLEQNSVVDKEFKHESISDKERNKNIEQKRQTHIHMLTSC